MNAPALRARSVARLTALAMLLLAVAPLAGAKKPPPSAPTIGDLDQAPVNVQPSAVPSGSASRAMENYRASCSCRTRIRSCGPRRCAGSGT